MCDDILELVPDAIDNRNLPSIEFTVACGHCREGSLVTIDVGSNLLTLDRYDLDLLSFQSQIFESGFFNNIS